MHRVIEAVTLLYVEIALALLIAARALEERLAPPLQKGRSMTTAAAELLALASSIVAETEWDLEEDVSTLSCAEDSTRQSGEHWLSPPRSERALQWVAR